MALKLVQAHVSEGGTSAARDALLEAGAEEVWDEAGGSFGTLVSAVLGAQRTGPALDLLHARLASHGPYRVTVHPLDAVLPRPPATAGSEARSALESADAVSREEIYASIADHAQLTRTYLALVVLASVVAAIGLSKNNTAAVIGAMVVAPLLGPNMGIALGLTLADGTLVRGSLRAAAAGLVLSILSAMGLGLVLDVDPNLPEIASRTQVDVADLVLALAAGCAGTLAYTTGTPAYLTGVMVAVALLPPAVAGGLLLGEGELRGGLAALLLAVSNVTALTLAAMLTFLWRGMRPRLWWREEVARRSARQGVAIFLTLFVLLTAVILASRSFFER